MTLMIEERDLEAMATRVAQKVIQQLTTDLAHVTDDEMEAGLATAIRTEVYGTAVAGAWPRAWDM